MVDPLQMTAQKDKLHCTAVFTMNFKVAWDYAALLSFKVLRNSIWGDIFVTPAWQDAGVQCSLSVLTWMHVPNRSPCYHLS